MFRKIAKSIQFYKNYGFRAFVYRVVRPNGPRPIDYAKWLPAHRVSDAEWEAQRQAVPDLAEQLTAVLCGCTGDSFPHRLQDALAGQSCPPKTVLRYEDVSADLSGVPGTWLIFCDADCFPERDAFYELAKAAETADLVYADEGRVDATGTVFSTPCFKPDFSPEYLTGVNYIGRFFCVKKEIVEAAGGLPEIWDEIGIWDLLLRCMEQDVKVAHVAKPLVHFVDHVCMQARPAKTKRGTRLVRGGPLPEQAERVVEAHLARTGKQGKMERADTGTCLRFLPDVEETPLVSILIPNCDQAETLRTCVASILERSTYARYEILILENNSEKEETFAFYRQLEAQDARIHICPYGDAFNFSAINNFGAAQAKGEYLLLLNNDTEVLTPDWIERLLGYAQQKEIGAVGAKLLYPDGTLQHAGVIVGIGGVASHVLSKEDREEDGYLSRLQAITDLSAVTAACMLVRREVYQEVQGLDESFTVNFNDVDFCLRLRQKGYRIVMHPGVELFHYESKSRGLDDTNPKFERFKGEIMRFRERWSAFLKEGDPYYNPNLSCMYIDCRIRQEVEHFSVIDQIERERRASV